MVSISTYNTYTYFYTKFDGIILLFLSFSLIIKARSILPNTKNIPENWEYCWYICPLLSILHQVILVGQVGPSWAKLRLIKSIHSTLWGVIAVVARIHKTFIDNRQLNEFNQPIKSYSTS